MDTETQAAITAMGETILARMDHYFELQQAQFLEWRAELRGDLHDGLASVNGSIADLRERIDALTDRVSRLEHVVAQLRDYVTREVGEIRLELRDLGAHVDQTDELRREIAGLTARVDRLERQN